MDEIKIQHVEDGGDEPSLQAQHAEDEYDKAKAQLASKEHAEIHEQEEFKVEHGDEDHRSEMGAAKKEEKVASEADEKALQARGESIWEECVDDNGNKFWFNTVTNSSQWTMPDDLLIKVEAREREEVENTLNDLVELVIEAATKAREAAAAEAAAAAKRKRAEEHKSAVKSLTESKVDGGGGSGSGGEVRDTAGAKLRTKMIHAKMKRTKKGMSKEEVVLREVSDVLEMLIAKVEGTYVEPPLVLCEGPIYQSSLKRSGRWGSW